jgi:2-polyprenyl-3-methyl-5-hydroxy-6-metoxy-1,4-benzoquinol methylase
MTEEAPAAPQPTSHYDRLVSKLGLSEVHLALLRRVPERSVVLELGPASGYLTRALRDRGCTVDAIELNEADAAKARAYCRRIEVGSIEEAAPWQEMQGPYDVALCADVLEHLAQPERALARIRERLRPGGLLLASLPNVAHWSLRVQLLRGRFDYTATGLLDSTHLRFFTIASAGRLFRGAAFHLESADVPPPRQPRFRRLKGALKRAWPELFAPQMVYVLRPAAAPA